MKEPILAGLDVGSASIKTVIARVNNDKLDVIGIGESESEGIKKGVIINIDAAANAIEKSINEAEHMAGLQAPDIIASIFPNKCEKERVSAKNSAIPIKTIAMIPICLFVGNLRKSID